MIKKDSEVQSKKPGIEYVVYYNAMSGLNLSQAIDACRGAVRGKIIAVRNSKREVSSLCKRRKAIAITAARRNSELASNHRAIFCHCIWV